MSANQADVKAFLRRVPRPGALEAAASGRDFSLLDRVRPSDTAPGPVLASAAAKALSEQPLTASEQFFLEAIIGPGPIVAALRARSHFSIGPDAGEHCRNTGG
jgi:hypothetical protein